MVKNKKLIILIVIFVCTGVVLGILYYNDTKKCSYTLNLPLDDSVYSINMEQEDKVVMIDEQEKKEANGIKISNDVIAVIAGVAVSEVSGVASMSGGFAGGITEAIKGKKNLAKGIKVEATEKEAKIDVNIIVEFGSRIPDVAFEIQNRVKKAVENMTGIKVTDVNVNVQGVNTEILNNSEIVDTEEPKQENE